jgi:hypothetical protein
LAVLEQPIQRLIAKATAGEANTDSRLPACSHNEPAQSIKT